MTVFNRIRRLTESGLIDVPTTATSGASLASGFFITPSVVSYNGANYDLSTEGLYSIFSMGESPAYANGGYSLAYGSNITELMRSLMFQTQYGREDETLTASDALNQLRMRKVGMRCDAIDALVTAPILASKSVPHRTVRLLTAGAPNGFDDGHVACEVKIGGSWYFFDVPTKMRVEASGVVQNIHQIITSGLANLTTVQMCPCSAYPETWSGTLLQTQVYFDQNLLFQSDLTATRNRLYQIPGIVDTDGLTYFYMPSGTASRQSWVLGLSSSYRVLSEADWLTKFYP